MNYRIPLSYNAIDQARLSEVLQSYSGLVHSGMIHDFEARIAQVTGAKYVVALNSGTAAIHMGLIALDVRQGDEVLVSDFTYVASINPILYLGARPVFVDSEMDTWNMDPDLLRQAILDRRMKGVIPKAIIVVHVYGMPARMHEIQDVAMEFGIPILEDTAEAFGSTMHGNQVGRVGKIGIFSFNNNKIITTFGGGALITDDENVYRKVLLLSEQAREDMPYYDHREIGYTYRMGPLNAAMGLAQLSELDTRLARRKETFDFYRTQLKSTGATFLIGPDGYESNRWLTTLVWNDRDEVTSIMEGLKSVGIEARYLWRPMHKQRVFKDFIFVTNGISTYLFAKGLSLPSGNGLTDSELEEVSNKIHEGLAMT